MKKAGTAFAFIIGALSTLFVFSQIAFRDKNETRHQWYAPDIPKQMSFAGEKVPLERWDVKEKFDREFLLNYYSPGTIIYLLKLANRNFPVITERLKANGVPEDFKYLCIAESNMQSWAISKSGAVGYWQFLNGTAPGYGLETSQQVDQRQDLAKSTDAACKYLKQAYARFGNWTAAAASYNCGMGGYNAQATFQRTKDYYNLHLPEETNKYIFRILAFKYLMENAPALGFTVAEDEMYTPVDTRVVRVTSTIPDLAQFAISNGTNYKMLRTLNPWLKGRSLSVGKGKVYELHLPAK